MTYNNMEDSYSMESKEKANEELFSKFNDVLFSLDFELNPSKTSTAKQQIYKRLSGQYVSSPKKFTEKLITIIEESVVNSTLKINNNSIIIFEKISKELQKMCDNLENESMPEQLLSTTIGSSPNEEISKIIMEDNPTKKTIEKSDLSSALTLNTESCTIKTPSPPNTSKKVYRKTPKSVFKSRVTITDDTKPLSPSTYNNMSFEYLEAYCERLFPDEKKDRTSMQTVSDSTVLSMDPIVTICERQLASLDSPSSDIKVLSQKKKEDSVKANASDSKMQPTDVICHPYIKSESSTCKEKDRNKKLTKRDGKTYKANLASEYIHCTDELDKTILSEIAEKRKRCLDTAKKMIEINSECDTMEVQKESKADSESMCEVDSIKPQYDINNFLKVLMSCKDYHDYLKNQLPMLNASVSSKTVVTDVNTNKTNIKNLNFDLIPNKNRLFTNQQNNSKSRRSKSYTENYRKILARWNIDSDNKEEKAEKAVNNPKLFTTPGKISAKDKRVQKVFFSDMQTAKKQKSPLRTSMNRNKQLNNINFMSRSHLHRKESLKPSTQSPNNQLSPKSVKTPQKKGFNVNTTHTLSSKYLIKRNLSALRKRVVEKNKENTVN